MKKNLNKKFFSILIINLLIIGGFSFIFWFSSDNTTVEGAILTVNDDGGGAMYTTIQSAVNAANPGDIIQVWAGTYQENLVINKKITLKGNGSTDTIIDGRGLDKVIYVTSNWVNISGFKLFLSGNSDANHHAGIDLYFVSNCKISNCYFTNNRCGIFIRNSLGSNKIINNKFDTIDNHGIYLINAINEIIYNNDMDKCGIFIEGDNVNQWSSHTISLNNTVNQKPIYYYKNQINGNIPPSAGQVILSNCTTISVINQNLNDSSIGIILGYSSSCILENNNCSNNSRYGIHLYFSENNEITNNTCMNNYNGIYLHYYCDDNYIFNNTCNFSGFRGIYLESACDNNEIINNSCSNNHYGIQLESSNKYNKIINNTCNFNEWSGIYIESNSDVNYLENNSCNWNERHGIQIDSSGTCKIFNNTCNFNGDGGISLYPHASSNIVFNNSCHFNYYGGIGMGLGSNNNIKYNKCFNNKVGISMGSPNSENNKMYNNTCNNNMWGISLVQLDMNNNIFNNTYFNNSVGIDLGNSNNLKIYNNTCFNNSVGIDLDTSNNNYIENNYLSNRLHGIKMYSSTNNKIYENKMFLTGIVLRGTQLEYWNTQTIPINNTVNDKPVYYWKNLTVGKIPQGAGEVILANCSNIYIEDQIAKGIEIGFSDNITINNNTCSDQKYGFYIQTSTSINLTNNTCLNNNFGFCINSNTLKTIIKNNKIFSNYNGIYFNADSNASVQYNKIHDNENMGIYNTESSILVNATYNWWGDSSGPYHSLTNPTGSGDNVSDWVKYIPWLMKENIAPIINTMDNTTAIEDIYYEITYRATDLNWDPITWRYNSNAVWLKWGASNQTLFGKPTNEDVGNYWICINVTDGVGGYDEHNFTLTVLNINDLPIISTIDINFINEDEHYEVTYNAIEIDIGNILTWIYESNATWLNWGTNNHTLYGTPRNDDVGFYLVRINVSDGNNGFDEHNFILSVNNTNDPPSINTSDITSVQEDQYYEVIYNATEIDLGDTLIWNYDSNATWLNWGFQNHTIFGTPENKNIGTYWVKINITDGNNGYDEHNFTLTVINVNDCPNIISDDEEIAFSNILYKVDYNATDIDSPLSQLTWLLNTNASWLNVDSNTGILSGTPLISDLGWYNVNITVDDGDGGQDCHNFILSVEKGNDPPEITTIDKVSITAGESYNNIYEAIDDRTPLDSLLWSFNSNASWLSFSKLTRSLSGNPTLSHVGWYWVNVTVNDGEGGFDSHNFTLTVYATANEPPDIQTDDDVNAVVGELFSVDYDAEDDRTPFDKLQWSLDTNTSDWLGIDPITGLLSGTPEQKDVGSYWVEVSVFDGEDGWDHNEFTLYVTTEPITKFEPKLSNPSMTPTSGNIETLFIFSVDYSHPEGDPPDSIQVVIDGVWNDMTSSNGHYEYNTKLTEGNHTYYFTATLDELTVETEDLTTPYIEKAEVPPEDGDGDGDKDSTMLYAGIGIIVIIIIVVLILLFIFLKKKKEKEEEPIVEEPPPEEVPPEAPSPEQPPTTEIPTEQPPTPEVPLEQVPVPETPPPEQPQVPEVPPEQPPTPEVTPQVVPQIEPAPSPEPVPMQQVEEQPQASTPQVEQPPQPQVEAQEPAVEQPEEPQPQPTPTIKTEPTIEENDT